MVCFWRLGAVGLIHMEGMIVDGARHMLAQGDWAVPHVYGELYTYKPALAYWLAAGALALADPVPEWLLRLPFAASGFLMGLAALLLLLRVVKTRTALVAALSSVSGALFVQHVRLGEFDVPLAAGVGVAVAAACVDLASDRASAGRWLLAYAGLAFGFLAKGLPALMCFGPGLLMAAVACGRWRRLFDWRHLTGVALFLALSTGYLAAAYRTAGPAAFEQPLNESRVRGLSWNLRQHSSVLSVDAETPVAEVAARPLDAVLRTLTKPLEIWVSFLPWSLVLPFAFARGGAGGGGPVEGSLVRSGRAFLVAGAVVFMLVPTHETRYFLPLAVPVGILCGVVMTREGTRPGRLLGACGAAAILSALAMLVFGGGADTPPVAVVNRVALVAGGLGLLALAVRSLRRSRTEPAVLLMVLAAIGWLAAESLSAQLRRAGKGRDHRALAARLDPLVPAEAPIWVLGPADPAGKHASLYYYLGRPVETFRPPAELPPAGSRCLLTTDRLPRAGALRFEEIERFTTPRYTYLLGRCGSSGPGSSGPSTR